MSEFIQPKESLGLMAFNLATNARVPGYRLHHLAHNPNAALKKHSWTATLYVDRINNFYNGVGRTPVDAVLIALCYEALSRQGNG